MKPALFAVSLICASVLAGCSQNSNAPTEPAGIMPNGSTQSTPSSGISKPSESSNTLHEDAVLVDPLNKGDTIEVAGNVQYSVAEIPILSREEVRVAVAFNGQATSAYFDGPEAWHISGKSVQTVTLDSKGNTTLDQAYPLEGWYEPVSLHIRYLVTDTQVQVETMWLAPSTADVASAF